MEGVNYLNARLALLRARVLAKEAGLKENLLGLAGKAGAGLKSVFGGLTKGTGVVGEEAGLRALKARGLTADVVEPMARQSSRSALEAAAESQQRAYAASQRARQNLFAAKPGTPAAAEADALAVQHSNNLVKAVGEYEAAENVLKGVADYDRVFASEAARQGRRQIAAGGALLAGTGLAAGAAGNLARPAPAAPTPEPAGEEAGQPRRVSMRERVRNSAVGAGLSALGNWWDRMGQKFGADEMRIFVVGDGDHPPAESGNRDFASIVRAEMARRKQRA